METVQKNNAAGAGVPYPYAYTVSPPPRRGLRRCTSGWPGRSGRARALGATRVPWPAISVLITADVAVSTRGLINYSYSAWGISASDKQSAACLFALPSLCG